MTERRSFDAMPVALAAAGLLLLVLGVPAKPTASERAAPVPAPIRGPATSPAYVVTSSSLRKPEFRGADWSVVGEVQNLGPGPGRLVRVDATGYDERGAVVATSWNYLPGNAWTIGEGELAPFEVTFFGASGGIAAYRLAVSDARPG